MLTKYSVAVRVVVITLALAAVYTAVWFFIAFSLKNGVMGWVEERRSDGWRVEHGSVTIGGFPFAWRTSIATPLIERKAGEPGLFWTGPYVALEWAPWRGWAFDFRTSGSHMLRLGTGAEAAIFPIALANGNGRLVREPTGKRRRLNLAFDDVRIEPANGQPSRINQLRVFVDTHPPPEKTSNGKSVKPHQVPSLLVDGEIFGLTLPQGRQTPLGRTIGKISLRGTVLGRIPPGKPFESLSVWQNDGGTVEISRLELGWASLVVRATGTMALDADLQPIGALTGAIAGYEDTLDALVAAEMIRSGPALMTKFALTALARTPDGGGRPEIEVPLSVQERWLFVGPVKLLRLPQVRWN